MKFVYPEFLYALIAVAIPIIVHLFNFKKFKKVYFSNVQFLKEVKQETQSKSKLKHLLVLLSRILAITFLVLAFAQPFIPSSLNNKNNNNIVGIYIDNSFSMESLGENGSLLDESKLKATEIVNSYRKTDHFVIVDNNFKPESQRLLSAEDAIDKIEEIQISSASRNLSSVVVRIKDVLNDDHKNSTSSLYILSDFQKSTTDFINLPKDTLVKTYFVPALANKINNLYIDSCWFETPTHVQFQQEQLKVQIRNNSDQDLENIPLKLYLNEQLVTPASFSVKANDKKILDLNFQNKTQGIQNGKIELRDHPVTMDDNFFFSYQISDQINVLEIKHEKTGNQIEAVYKTDSVFKFTSQNVVQQDYSLINKSDLVILNQLDNISSGLANTIHKFVTNGGHLDIIPSSEINLENYKEFLALLGVNYYSNIDTSSNQIKYIADQHPIYQNVFEGKPEQNINLPKVNHHYTLSSNSVNYRNNVLILKNDEIALAEYQVENGKVYLSTFSIDKDWSNFSSHALFVPTYYNIGLLSQPQYPLFYVIGENASLQLDRVENESVFHIKGSNFDVIPKTQTNNYFTTVFVSQNILSSGNYLLTSKDHNIGLSFNYNRNESNLSCFSPEEIKEHINTSQINAQLVEADIQNMNSSIHEINSGKKYWKLCIILALLFLATEIALIKLLK